MLHLNGTLACGQVVHEMQEIISMEIPLLCVSLDALAGFDGESCWCSMIRWVLAAAAWPRRPFG